MYIGPYKLGAAIRSARIKKGYSQEKLAEILDISPIHLKHIEGGHRSPSITVLFHLAETLDISLDALLVSGDARDSSERKQAAHLMDLCDDRELRIVIALMEALFENRDST